MGKTVVALFVSVVCLLALAGIAHSAETFNVEGKVYCDTCRVLFPTKLSQYLADVEVELKCRCLENRTVTLTLKDKTDKDGHYNMIVPGDHEDEICEVTAISSPDPNCADPASEINSAKVSLDKNSGIKSMDRYVNPIGFRQKKALDDCISTLDELGFVPLKDIQD